MRAVIGADVATLTTTAKTVVPAINELKGNIGDVSTLDTTATTLVTAINELVSSVDDALTTVTVSNPITGDGTSGTPLAVTMASGAQITTGTNTVYPVNSAGLRQLMGLDVASLTTTNKTVVPAINELVTSIAALASPLRFMGTYDATAHEAEIGGGAAAVLPPAAAGNEGYVLIVTVAGTGVAPAPAVPMTVGDWLVSDGTQWLLIDLDMHNVAAGNVSVSTISGLTATNVQAALAEIIGKNFIATVAVDGTTILGDGTTGGTPLYVGTVDGGTY